MSVIDSFFNKPKGMAAHRKGKSSLKGGLQLSSSEYAERQQTANLISTLC